MTFENGDIILVKVNHFTAWYRWLLAKLIQLFDGVYYHHAQIYYEGFLWEANTEVVAQEPAYNQGDEVIVLRLKKQLSHVEHKRLQHLMSSMAGLKYDYWAVLLHQLVYILTFRRIWIGRKGKAASRKPYCTEFVTAIMHDLRGYFPEHYKIGPSKLLQYAALYYEVVYEGTY